MLSIRKANERGHFDHGWLKTSHTFSFSDYYDPKFMGFGPLRVINEDFIEAGAGFPTHGHRDMEIVTYVVSGAVAHKDSTGSEGVIHPGELQKMTAGSGIRHSEYNYYKDQETHLYQIWLMPDEERLKPGYEQKDFTKKLNSGAPTLLVSKDGREDSIVIHQEADLWAKRFQKSEVWNIPLQAGKIAWVQVVKGQVQVNSHKASVGDGVAVGEEPELRLSAENGCEVLVFVMAK